MLRILRPVVEFFVPPLCLSCGRRRESRTSRICSACSAQMSPAETASALLAETAAKLAAGGGVEAFTAAYLFEKDRPLQALLHALKYGGNTAIGTELGEVLARRVLTAPWANRVTGVVPVPLHRIKQRERGYNQAAIIAEAVAGMLGVACLTGVLRRVRPTATQTHLGANEREENVAGAFDLVPGSEVRGMRLLLIDDVVTTGATMSEAGEVLRRAGAAECFGAAVAIAAL